MKHSLKHRVEYGLALFWFGVFRVLPYRVALGLGWCAAWWSHYVLRYRRGVVFARIRQVFPGIEEGRVREIAWLSWRNLFFNLIDLFRVAKMDGDWLRRHVLDYETVAAEADRVREQGMVAVSLHMGCSELPARLLQERGAEVFVLSKPQKNLLVTEKLFAMRSETGIGVLPVSDGVYRQVLKRLRKGEVLALLADLRVDDGGIAVDFLGQKAYVGAGAALFAKRGGVPLLCAIVMREGWCRHRIEVRLTLNPDESLSVEEDLQRMMQAIFVEFEKVIRERPEQWFWYNKKWILG